MKKKVLIAVQAVSSAAILYFLLRNVSFGQVTAALAQINLGWYLLFAGCTLCAIPIYVFRWSKINRLFGIAIAFPDLLQIYVISLFFTSLLPGSLGGDGYRAFILSSRTKSPSRSIINILLERGSALYIMIVTGTLVALLERNTIPHQSVLLLSAISIGMTAAILIGLALSAIQLPETLIRKKHLGAFLQTLVETRQTIVRSPGIMLQVVLLTLLYQTLANTIVIFLIWSLGFNARIADVYVLSTLVFTLINIPISINGIGLREALFVYFFGLLGLTKETTLLISLLVFLTGIGTSLLGGVFYLVKKTEHFRNRVAP